MSQYCTIVRAVLGMKFEWKFGNKRISFVDTKTTYLDIELLGNQIF
jgi:hypothetical protein